MESWNTTIAKSSNEGKTRKTVERKIKLQEGETNFIELNRNFERRFQFRRLPKEEEEEEEEDDDDETETVE
jgi:hypothetical protein